MPADARPGAPVARRGGGVSPGPWTPDANRRLRAAEPLRGLPRGAVCARQPWVRAVAADEVPVVRRARGAWVPGGGGAPREKHARDARGRAPARPYLPGRARAHGGRPALAAPRRGGSVRAPGSAARAGAEAQGPERPRAGGRRG